MIDLLPSRDTVIWLEVVWTIWCALFSVLAVWLNWDVFLDARAIYRAKTNGIRRATTHLCIGITSFFSITLLGFTAIGIVAMYTAQPPKAPDGTPAQIVSTIVFCSAATLAGGICLWWRIIRIRSRSYGVPPDVATAIGDRRK